MLPKKSYCEDCEHSSPGSHPDAHLSVERGASRRLANFEVIISQELLDQVARVAKRLRNKDWSGELIDLIWQNLNSHYVILADQAWSALEYQAVIPREDIGVYLTAQVGEADYFVSANHKLIRSLVADTQDFDCLTPGEFIERFLTV